MSVLLINVLHACVIWCPTLRSAQFAKVILSKGPGQSATLAIDEYARRGEVLVAMTNLLNQCLLLFPFRTRSAYANRALQITKLPGAKDILMSLRLCHVSWGKGSPPALLPNRVLRPSPKEGGYGSSSQRLLCTHGLLEVYCACFSLFLDFAHKPHGP